MLYIEIALVLVLTLVNGVLALSELSVVSSRPAKLKVMEERGQAGATAALALNADPGRFLSTVQIGITLVGIVSGAFSGATLGDRLAAWFGEIGFSTVWAYVFGVGIVVTIITYLSLIIGELVPKQLALRDPEGIACAVAPAMTVLSRVAHPLVVVLDGSGRLVLRLIGQGGGKEQRVTDEEIQTIVAEAETAGVIEPEERAMISGVMRLADRPVRGVMTPRHECRMIDLSAPLSEALATIRDGGHSRYPVHEGTPDQVIGILEAKALAGVALRRMEQLKAVVRPAPVIPETVDAIDAVEMLKASPVHMGLVHDEYGHFQGVVTSADILEAIVGTFADETGIGEVPIVERADGSLLVAGWMPAPDFAERLGLKLPAQRSFETTAGFLVQMFGRLPDVGDRVSFQNWTFEIVDMDGRRIDKVIAAPRSEETGRSKTA